MTALRPHPRGADSHERRLAPALLALAMLVIFVPHCIFGCSTATPVAIAGAMDGCDAACPMEHSGECRCATEQSSAPEAVLKQVDPGDPTFEPIGPAEDPARAESLAPSIASIERATVSPPVPIHLLNAQFLI